MCKGYTSSLSRRDLGLPLSARGGDVAAGFLRNCVVDLARQLPGDHRVPVVVSLTAVTNPGVCIEEPGMEFIHTPGALQLALLQDQISNSGWCADDLGQAKGNHVLLETIAANDIGD